MIQQVNLYQEVLWQQRKQPALIYYLSALLLLALSLTGLAFYLNSTLTGLEIQLQSARSDLQQQKSQVAQLQKELPERKLDEKLAIEIERWQQQVAELKRSINLLDMKKMGREQKFSAHFHAFAARALDNIWLSRIHVNRQETTIALEGTTLKPEKLPLFLQGLQKESAFSDYSFSSLLMEQSKETPELVHFKLSTVTKEDEEKNEPR